VFRLAASLSELGSALSSRRDLPGQYDGVFHLAACTPKFSGDDDPGAVIASNIVGMERLLAGLAGRTGRLVFASTLDVYGSPGEGEVVSEQSPLRPTSLYAVSKLFGELMVGRWAPSGTERSAILRVGHIYGPGEGAYRKLIPETIRRLISGQPARLVGSGEELRDLLFVDDAAEGMVRAWEALERGSVGPLNLVSGRAITVRRIIELLCEEAGRAGHLIQEPAAGPGRSLQFDASLAERSLGAYVRTDFREGIRKEIDWFRTGASGA
jgi:nucleoside-diphosphate-sugar epimerase